MESGMDINGLFTVEVFDKEGKLIGHTIGTNLITDQGLNHILNTELHGETQVATWYCAVVSTNTAAASTMTYAVPVYTEMVAYDEATRPAYNEASSAAHSISNSSNKAAFTVNSSGTTLYGAALMSCSIKGDTATTPATLFCYALFSTAQPVIATNVVNLTYIVTAS